MILFLPGHGWIDCFGLSFECRQNIIPFIPRHLKQFFNAKIRLEVLVECFFQRYRDNFTVGEDSEG